MSANSKIEWTDYTWNPWLGCEKVSQGCKNCYAERETPIRIARRRGVEMWGPSGIRQVTADGTWEMPHRWNRQAARDGVRRRVFPSLCDPFEDRPELVGPRAGLFSVIEKTSNLDWLLLTKRPENVRRMVEAIRQHWGGDQAPYFENLWIGTSVENQEQADKRIPELLNVPAHARFLSCEPLLGPLDLSHVANSGGENYGIQDGVIDWVIVGGESGPGARSMERAWAQQIVRDCNAAGVPAFVKQLGAAYSDPENGIAGRRLCVPREAEALISRRLVHPKGGDPVEWPEWAKVRDLPAIWSNQNKGGVR